MATVKKYTAKDGSVSYHIRCYHGYDSKGKQVEHTMTWKPTAGMTPKQIDKELQRQMVMFEQSVRNGTCFDSNTRFKEYAEKWLENNSPPILAPKTFEGYTRLLKNINMAIGEIKLTQLQSHHLQEFYHNLREDGIKKSGTYAIGTKLKQTMKKYKITQAKLSELSGISEATIRTACNPGRHISIASAELIAKGLNLPVTTLFEIHNETSGLSSRSILHYHRLISTILTQATRDRLIPNNVADRNFMKAPKVENKEAVFLDDEQAQRVIALLDNVPIKWKTAMYLLIFSGMRRGELMGLEWKDVDFEHRVIHIRRTSQYVKKMGIITKLPKNNTSIRTIKLSEMIFDLLHEYQNYWNTMRKDLGDIWKNNIEITLVDGSKKMVKNDRLFVQEDSTPMCPDSVTCWTRKFVIKNNLPRFSPHSLRHTHATLLIAEGASIPAVSHRLGHSNIATTSKIYLHAIQTADEIASDMIDDKLNPLKNKKAESE